MILRLNFELATEQIQKAIDIGICTCCIITQALNRTFKGEVFDTGITIATSSKRKLNLSEETKRITRMHNRDWKNVKPFTFTATEY